MATTVRKAGDLVFRGDVGNGQFSANINGWNLHTDEVPLGCQVDLNSQRGRQILLEAVVLHIAQSFGVKVILGEREPAEPRPTLEQEREMLDAIAVARWRPQEGEGA